MMSCYDFSNVERDIKRTKSSSSAVGLMVYTNKFFHYDKKTFTLTSGSVSHA